MDLAGLDVSCGGPIAGLSIDAGAGDLTRSLQPFTPALNESLVKAAFSQTTRANLNQLPPAVVLGVARYPQTTRCEQAE